jgi:hypothetical protein
LRVLSSEAVLNPFPPVPNFFPTNTELDEFRILRGQSFEPVDCDGILKIGRKLGIGTSGGAAGFQAGAAPILTGSSGHLSGPLNERIGEGGHVRFYCDSRLNADVARGPKSAMKRLMRCSIRDFSLGPPDRCQGTRYLNV